MIPKFNNKLQGTDCGDCGLSSRQELNPIDYSKPNTASPINTTDAIKPSSYTMSHPRAGLLREANAQAGCVVPLRRNPR